MAETVPVLRWCVGGFWLTPLLCSLACPAAELDGSGDAAPGPRPDAAYLDALRDAAVADSAPDAAIADTVVNDAAAAANDLGSVDTAAADAAAGDVIAVDATVADAAEGAFVEAPVYAPSGSLCHIPDGYVEQGGDPVHVPCDVEVDHFSDFSGEVPAQVRVVTWNIEYGVASEQVADTLLNHPDLAGAHVLLLQEVARHDQKSVPQGINQARDLAQLLGMNYAFAVEWDRRLNADELGEHGNAVLSKFPIGGLTQIRHVPLNDWYAEDNRYGGRMALGVDLLMGDRVLRVYSSHLCLRPLLPSDEGRAEQGAEIRADADLPGRAVAQVVGGDFNTWTCNPALADCTRAPAAEAVVRDFRAAAWLDGTEGFNGSTHNVVGFPVQRLDWLFYRGLGAVAGTVADDAQGADHLPLWFDVWSS